MPDTMTSDLTALDMAAPDDLLPIVDTSANETKKMAAAALGEMRVAIVTTDLNTGTHQLLYTVPAGMHFQLTKTLMRDPSTGLTTGDVASASVSSGVAGSASTTHDFSTFTTAKVDLRVVAAGTYAPLGEGDTLILSKADPFGVAATVVVEIFGILY